MEKRIAVLIIPSNLPTLFALRLFCRLSRRQPQDSLNLTGCYLRDAPFPTRQSLPCIVSFVHTPDLTFDKTTKSSGQVQVLFGFARSIGHTCPPTTGYPL